MQDNLHPEQMRLFMRPSEIMSSVTGSEDAYEAGESLERTWDRKEWETKQPKGKHRSGGLYKTLKKEQVRNPVELYVRQGTKLNPWEPMSEHLEMGEGHHRVAAAAAVERATRGRVTHWVPVEYLPS